MKSIEAKVVVLGSQGKRLKTFYCVCCIVVVVVWFGLDLYAPVNNFSVMSGRIVLG